LPVAIRTRLLSARRRGWLREGGEGVGEASAALVWLGLAAVLATQLTARGDLVRPAVSVLAAAAIAVAMDRALRRGVRRWGSLSATARTLAALAGERGAGRGEAHGEPRDVATRDVWIAVALAHEAEAGELRGSPALADAFIAAAAEIHPGTAAGRWSTRARRGVGRASATLVAGLAALAAGVALGWAEPGLSLLLGGRDGRPAAPAAAPWSTLAVRVEYPPHTGRGPQRLDNPSGGLRVPRGTLLTFEVTVPRGSPALEVVRIEDPAPEPGGGATAPPETAEPAPAQAPAPLMAPERWSLVASPPDATQTAPPAAIELRNATLAVQRAAVLWLGPARDTAAVDPPRAAGGTVIAVDLEPDRAPDVELEPLPPSRQQVTDTDDVTLHFTARDDFGLTAADLVVRFADGTERRQPLIGTGVGDARNPLGEVGARGWDVRAPWSLASVPLADRAELSYWIEVFDNDPYAGGEAGDAAPGAAARPGKRTRSAVQRLVVDDEEARHAANLRGLLALRDRAVDALAARMTTAAFAPTSALDGVPGGAASSDPASWSPRPLPDPLRGDRIDPLEPSEPALDPRLASLQAARTLLQDGGALLTAVTTAIDDLMIDPFAPEADVAVLRGVHERLTALHRKELGIHEELPPGIEWRDPTAVTRGIAALATLHPAVVRQLEDEIIRLDDLVDGEILARLEALVARLQATQQQLVDALERLKAGDTAARPLIEQLQARRRDDLRRVAEARAMLRKELGEEFFNADAFAVMERLASGDQGVQERLDSGDIDGAIERAREELGDVQELRDGVQQQLGAGESAQRLSPEEQRRMQLLRELSRLQDQQADVRQRTDAVDRQWREAVAQTPLPQAAADTAAERATALTERLEAINDARLGRDARAGLELAKRAMAALRERTASPGTPGDSQPPATGGQPRSEALALEALDRAEGALEGLEQAQRGAASDEREGRQIREALRQARALRDGLRRELPGVTAGEDADANDRRAKLEQSRAGQGGLQRRATELERDELATALPDDGRAALRAAATEMATSDEQLGEGQPAEASRAQMRARDALQRAIDSLRRGGSPPPSAAASGEASTDAERDRSLRDALLEAMRRGAPAGYDGAVERYYEELLR
jgi:hypothetical protein